jgi:hypothetical protein
LTAESLPKSLPTFLCSQGVLKIRIVVSAKADYAQGLYSQERNFCGVPWPSMAQVDSDLYLVARHRRGLRPALPGAGFQSYQAQALK